MKLDADINNGTLPVTQESEKKTEMKEGDYLR